LERRGERVCVHRQTPLEDLHGPRTDEDKGARERALLEYRTEISQRARR
jgi:hypothetical protein